MKLAVTALSADIVRLQAPEPEHSPDQPEKVLSVAGVAVRDTGVLAAKEAMHVDPQFILVPVTVPVPVPDFDTTSAKVAPGGGTLAVAETLSSRSTRLGFVELQEESPMLYPVEVMVVRVGVMLPSLNTFTLAQLVLALPRPKSTKV